MLTDGQREAESTQLRKWDSAPLPGFSPQPGVTKPIFCGLPTKHGRLQEMREEAGGWGRNRGRGGEVLSLWGSKPGRGVDGEFGGLSGEEATICHPVPAPPLQTRHHRAREGNRLAQGLRASQPQRQSQSPSLPSKPAVFSLLSYTFS